MTVRPTPLADELIKEQTSSMKVKTKVAYLQTESTFTFKLSGTTDMGAVGYSQPITVNVVRLPNTYHPTIDQPADVVIMYD